LPREWLGPGGLPGLQNRWRVALRAAVGSTPIHSRLDFKEGRVTPCRVTGYSTNIFHRYTNDIS